MTTAISMQYRRFGRTEIQMPVFSCGGMRYQQAWRDMPMAEVEGKVQKNVEAIIHRAIEVGINHIETARGYGSSERQLGQILPKLPRDQIIVQTKIGPTAKAEQFTSDFEDSLARLGLDYVDLLAIHGINDHQTLDWSVKPGGCFEAAQKLREQGKCRFVGFSTHGPEQVITEAINHGQARTGEGFDYVNLHWYYILRWNWPSILAATKRDMGVFIISPSDKGGMLYKPSDKLRSLCHPLHPITFNDLWCLRQPQVHTLSVGAARPSDFDEHLDALAHMDNIDAAIDEIDHRLVEAYNDAIEPELRDPGALGLPHWASTPGGMYLPVILLMRNIAKAWDMHEFAKMRYNLMGNGGHWFPGFKANKLLQPQVLDATRSLLATHPHGQKIIAAALEAHELLAGEERKRLSQGG